MTPQAPDRVPYTNGWDLQRLDERDDGVAIFGVQRQQGVAIGDRFSAVPRSNRVCDRDLRDVIAGVRV